MTEEGDFICTTTGAECPVGASRGGVAIGSDVLEEPLTGSGGVGIIRVGNDIVGVQEVLEWILSEVTHVFGFFYYDAFAFYWFGRGFFKRERKVDRAGGEIVRC